MRFSLTLTRMREDYGSCLVSCCPSVCLLLFDICLQVQPTILTGFSQAFLSILTRKNKSYGVKNRTRLSLLKPISCTAKRRNCLKDNWSVDCCFRHYNWHETSEIRIAKATVCSGLRGHGYTHAQYMSE